MRFALLIRSTRSSEVGVIPRPAPDDPDNALISFARMLAHDHVLVDIQGLHPTSEGRRVEVSWDKNESICSTFPEGREATDTFYSKDISRDSANAPTTAPRLSTSTDYTSRKLAMSLPGPFPVEESISGWVIVDVPDESAALAYAKKSPFPMVSDELTMEIRQVYDSKTYMKEGPKTTEMMSGSSAVQDLRQVIRQEGVNVTICRNIAEPNK